MKALLLSLILSQTAIASTLQLQPTSAVQKELLWTDGVMQLTRPTQGVKPKLGYAILKARPTPELHRLLPRGYSLTPLPQSWEINYYVAPIDSLDTLEKLAAWAHDSTHMCGSIEFVNLNSTVTTSTTIYPPIYGGRLALDDAKPFLEQISLTTMDQTINTLTSLPSRYYRHTTGETAHTTVRQIWEGVITNGRWTITEETQSLSNQKSIVARLEGRTKPDETIVIGAHLDSIISRSGNSAVDNSPGADDDASGVAALTEILRVIEANQMTFDRSIELQAYAAEEVGLVGSKEIAGRYAAAGKKIAGMLQIDMAYFSTAGNGNLFFLQDYTSRDLRRQAIDWIRNYMGQVYELGSLPRGSSSDHKSFYDQGYPTLFAFEDPSHYNPYIHTGNDTSAHFDDGVLQRRVTQMALLFAMHQGGLQLLATAYANVEKDQLPADLHQNLKLAIQTAESGHYLAVSAPIGTKTVEFCQIDGGTQTHCSQEREVLEKDSEGTARKFFYSSTVLGLTAGQKWRVLAYDSEDELIAWRQFTLNNP